MVKVYIKYKVDNKPNPKRWVTASPPYLIYKNMEKNVYFFLRWVFLRRVFLRRVFLRRVFFLLLQYNINISVIIIL